MVLKTFSGHNHSRAILGIKWLVLLAVRGRIGKERREGGFPCLASVVHGLG